MADITTRTAYMVEDDEFGIKRDYKTLTIAKREASKLAKRFAYYPNIVNVEVIEYIFYYKNGRLADRTKKTVAEYSSDI